MSLFHAFCRLFAKLAAMSEAPIEPRPAGKPTRPPACPNCRGRGWMPCICSLPHLCPVCSASAVVPAVYLAAMTSGAPDDVLEARSAYMRSAWRN